MTHPHKERDPPHDSLLSATVGTLVSLFLFGLLIAFLYGLFVGPILLNYAAKTWIPTPCTVISSREKIVVTEAGGFTTVEIHYSYTIKGHEYTSSRKDFRPADPMTPEERGAFMKEYEVGSETTCFVDPNNPTEAVLNRNLSWSDL